MKAGITVDVGATDGTSKEPVTSSEPEDSVSDLRTRSPKRLIAAAWLTTGSATAAFLTAFCYGQIRASRLPPAGDMSDHAAVAQWMRSLPWWDWRGWSDWFHGGKAIGVTYPPLSHLFLRFTHPSYGQILAVGIGLLVLLPWGALRIARATRYSPQAQATAVAIALMIPSASWSMYWLFSGFSRDFRSWPNMIAVCLGMFVAAWAAKCERPLTSGLVLGAAVLFNLTPIPGVIVVSGVLLATSGVSFGQGLRWMVTVGMTTIAVTAWWLVPFVHGLDRMTNWNFDLALALWQGENWGAVFLGSLGLLAALGARYGPPGARRLAAASGIGLLAVLAADFLEIPHSPARWLTLPIICAGLASAGLVTRTRDARTTGPVGLASVLAVIVAATGYVTLTDEVWVLPLAAVLLIMPRSTWSWCAALAWAITLHQVPLWDLVAEPRAPADSAAEAVLESGGDDVNGLVYLNRVYENENGLYALDCGYSGYPWKATISRNGLLRPLHANYGAYVESSPTYEFLNGELLIASEADGRSSEFRPQWVAAWQDAGRPRLYDRMAGVALGAKWYVECDASGRIVLVEEVPGEQATGTAIETFQDEESWHAAAVRWWIQLSVGESHEQVPVPAVRTGDLDHAAHPMHQAAQDVMLESRPDTLTISANVAGWAWLRVPWDVYWQSDADIPILKGGPGHLIVWLPAGVTTMRWRVPAGVDAAAAVVSGASLLAVVGMSVVNRRLGFQGERNRNRPVAAAVETFAETVDEWILGARGLLCRALNRARRALRGG